MNDKRFQKHRPQSSIDGFVGGSTPPKGGSQGGLHSFNRYHKPTIKSGASEEIRRIDSFSKSVDGFVSNRPAAISSSRQQKQSADISKAFEDKHFNQAEFESPEVSAKSGYTKSDSKKPKKDKKSFLSRFRRNKDKTKAKKPKSWKLKVGAAFATVLILIGCGLALRAFLISRNIFKGGGNSALLHNQDVDPSQLRGEGDGRINILILGKGGPEQQSGPDLTDTIIVASIDPIAKEAALLSIPRDFWVEQPSGYKSKINQVYADAKSSKLDSYSYADRDSNEAAEKAEKAGINAIQDVVSETMGIPLHYYGMIDFVGFRKAIDTVGGIDINVSEDMAVSESMWLTNVGRYYLDVDEGWEHFDGVRGLAFSRSRKTSAKGDFARSERQRAVILGLKDKVLSTGTLANPVKLNQLMSDFSGQLSTDFSVNEMLRLYDIGKEISGDKVVSVGLDEFVVGDMLNGLSVQVPKAGTFDYSEIQNYVRNVMRDAFLKKEDAKVMILNGTNTPGLATKKSDELKSFGYNVSSVGDAPTSTYQNTVLIDLRSGINKYTLNYLEKRLGVKAVSAMPDNSIDVSDADFVIILGSNETSSSQN